VPELANGLTFADAPTSSPKSVPVSISTQSAARPQESCHYPSQQPVLPRFSHFCQNSKPAITANRPADKRGRVSPRRDKWMPWANSEQYTPCGSNLTFQRQVQGTLARLINTAAAAKPQYSQEPVAALTAYPAYRFLRLTSPTVRRAMPACAGCPPTARICPSRCLCRRPARVRRSTPPTRGRRDTSSPSHTR